MGNFYTNVTVRRVTTAAAAATLEALGRTAYVSSSDRDAVVVFDAATESQDLDALAWLARELSASHETVAFAVLNHDDDVLKYLLYSSGTRLDEYDSRPGYFTGRDQPPSGGDVRLLCTACDAGDRADVVAAALHERFAIETGRHAALVEALGLPSAAVGTGYEYISQGELPESIRAEDLRTVGPVASVADAAAVADLDIHVRAVRDRLNTRVRPSPVLASIIGPGPFRYMDVPGMVYTYIFSHGLLDQTVQPLMVVMDDRLRAAFGAVDRMEYQKLMRDIERHLSPV